MQQHNYEKLGPSHVRSAKGFQVRRLSRFALSYMEGDAEVLIEVESGDGLAVYSSTIREWRFPPGREAARFRIREGDDY